MKFVEMIAQCPACNERVALPPAPMETWLGDGYLKVEVGDIGLATHRCKPKTPGLIGLASNGMDYISPVGAGR